MKTTETFIYPPDVEHYPFRLKHPEKGFVLAWMVDPDRDYECFPVFTKYPGKVEKDGTGYSEPTKLLTEEDAWRELRALANKCADGSLKGVIPYDLREEGKKP